MSKLWPSQLLDDPDADPEFVPDDLKLFLTKNAPKQINLKKSDNIEDEEEAKSETDSSAFALEPRVQFFSNLTKADGGLRAPSSYVSFQQPKPIKTEQTKPIEPVGDQLNVIKPRMGKRKLKKQKQAEREKTKGDAWFNMSAPEMTEETKRELEVLQMRSAVDPKRFYKKNDALPKYFQIGHVVDSPLDYYSNRGSGSKKKKSLVDELMADAEYQKYSKRKYAEIIDEKAKLQRKKFKKRKQK